nr:hypothetical protein [Lachnospiraceae bacterium]
QALQKQIYSNGNATNAGRSVFTGYRTGESLTFKEDTTADYRGIWDTFNASDITKNTYVEGAPTLDEINAVNPTGDETTVKEDRVNRIRLSYDNINGSVRKGVTAGFAHAETAGVSYSYDDYYDKDGSLIKSDPVEISMPGSDPDLRTQVKFHDPYDQTLVPVDEYVKGKPTDEPAALVDGNIIKVKYGDPQLTITLTRDSSGNYSADKGASVEKTSGGLTVTVPGPNGTNDLYTEIKLKEDGTEVKSQKMWKLTEANFVPEDSNYGGEPIYSTSGRALIYTTTASDTTTLVYRTELTGQASISQNSVTTDPVDGLQGFELNYGSTTYKIQKIRDEDRWFAVDGSGHPIKNIEVVQNADKSFRISVASDSSVEYDFQDHDCDVFNVSANGRSVTSYYHQTALKVQITDANSSVAVDSGGNELTAYQYLALGADDKNSDSTAANKIYLLADTGELVFGSDVAETLSSLKDIPGVDTISVMYDKSSFEAGELRPEHYFDTKQLDEKHNIVNKIVYDSHNQDINYTVGTNQSIKINTNAEDVFDTQIIREIDDVLTAISEYNFEEEKVTKLKGMLENDSSYSTAQKEDIQKMLDAANKSLDIAKNKLQRTYEEAITQFGKFFDQANLAETACGTVDNRLTLVSNRLSEEKTTVTTLASDNENVDITNIAVEVSEANLVYNAALMATGRISQQTLVDYI